MTRILDHDHPVDLQRVAAARDRLRNHCSRALVELSRRAVDDDDADGGDAQPQLRP